MNTYLKITLTSPIFENKRIYSAIEVDNAGCAAVGDWTIDLRHCLGHFTPTSLRNAIRTLESHYKEAFLLANACLTSDEMLHDHRDPSTGEGEVTLYEEPLSLEHDTVGIDLIFGKLPDGFGDDEDNTEPDCPYAFDFDVEHLVGENSIEKFPYRIHKSKIYEYDFSMEKDCIGWKEVSKEDDPVRWSANHLLKSAYQLMADTLDMFLKMNDFEFDDLWFVKQEFPCNLISEGKWRVTAKLTPMREEEA